MNYNKLLKQVESYVLSMFDIHSKNKLPYHNKKHTRFVVACAKQIANHYQLDEQDYFILIAAAWFHDTGYFSGYQGHEQKSAELATVYLENKNADATVIKRIAACILATNLPQKSTALLENILCDADLFHFGTADFIEKSELMREEHNKLNTDKVSKTAWASKTITLLESHRYQTDYCRLLLDEKKSENLEKLKDKTQKDMTDAGASIQDPPERIKLKKADSQKNKIERPDKGIETMFRVSSGNHSRLSDMADHKAHILITVNSIILSAIISLVLRKLDTSSFLTIPSFILLTVSLFTIIFAILATRPSIPQGIFTQNEIEQKKVNLLFFGNFYRMGLQEYTVAMNKVMDDRDFLYDNLIRDVYFQGIVLGRKYRLLRIAYNIFMFGLTVSVIAFIISSATADKHISHLTDFIKQDLGLLNKNGHLL